MLEKFKTKLPLPTADSQTVVLCEAYVNSGADQKGSLYSFNKTKLLACLQMNPWCCHIHL